MTRAVIYFVMGLALFGAIAGARAESSPSTQTTANATSPDQVAQTKFDLGVQLVSEHKFAGAARMFEQAIATRTNFPEAYNNWGICLVQLGKQAFNPSQQLQNYQTAAEKFAKAAELKPSEKVTYILWSETLVLIGDLPVDARTRLACYQGAVDKCRKATELAPNDWDSYNKWAVILSTKLTAYAVNNQARFDLYKESASLYAKAAEYARFSSEVGPVYANWADVLVRAAHVSSDNAVKLSLLHEALEKFDRAARARPGAAGTYAMWGSALIDLGKVTHTRNDFRDAVEKLNTSLGLRPAEPATLYDLARVYTLLGDSVVALDNLKKCLEADHTQTYRQTAAQDDDLATLRGNADFDELVGRTTPGTLPTYNPRLTDSPR